MTQRQLRKPQTPARHRHAWIGLARRLAMITGLFVILCSLPVPVSAKSDTCSADVLGETVDGIGESLRAVNRNSDKRFRPKLAALAKAKKMSMPIAENWVWQNLRDPRITDYDRRIDALIGEIDQLSDPPDDADNCLAIEQLKSKEKQLTTLLEQRSTYVLQELDNHIAGLNGEARTTAEANNASTQSSDQQPTSKPQLKAPQQKAITKKDAAPSASEWPAQVALEQQPAALPPVNEAVAKPMPALKTTFSVKDISDAGSGLFGNVSSHIAAAINGAFAKFGQPNAYVVGSEGGGAFLAGLRYGKGHVHFTDGSKQKIYWNGPSFGYDLGADGSKVMFLIYNLKTLDRLFLRYPGIEGTAYLAGGVGVTVLGRGGTTIVPIRSGVGLRLGASLAYLRFSPNRRWNPF